MTPQVMGRPRARLFGVLSILWLIPSIGALSVLLIGRAAAFGPSELLCTALLVPQPAFVGLAIWYALTETPRMIERRRRNPDYDVSNLY